MSEALPLTGTAAQQKSYVTYTAPRLSVEAEQVTLLETPSLLASSGTTGFRTWEAALFLGAFLTCESNHLVAQKSIIELGAGTGFLSILCAKHLGAHHVLATDGSPAIVNDLKTNLQLSKLEDDNRIQTSILQWGHPLGSSIADGRDAQYDLAIGADVTYDVTSIPALTATIRDLFELYPKLRIIISATIRNTKTLQYFIASCEKNGFNITMLDVSMRSAKNQIGFFMSTRTAVSVYLITKETMTENPVEIKGT